MKVGGAPKKSVIVDNKDHIADNLLISNVLNKYFATVGESLSKIFKVVYLADLTHLRITLIVLAVIVCLFIQYPKRN